MLNDIYTPVHPAIPQLLFFFFFNVIIIFFISTLMNVTIFDIHFHSLSSIQNIAILKEGEHDS